MPKPIRAAARSDGDSPRRRYLTKTTSTAQMSVATRIIASPEPKATVPAPPTSHAWPARSNPIASACGHAEALVEERHREQGNPDDERLLDERRLRRLGAREPLEEEDERHAAADQTDAEEREPLATRQRAGLRRTARAAPGKEDRDQQTPATRFFAVV